jgi:hypothetical protein
MTNEEIEQTEHSTALPAKTRTLRLLSVLPGAKERLNRLRRQLWWRMHWLAPNWIPPEPRSDIGDQRLRDEKSNGESCVPKQDELRLSALWGVEIFGPNESEALYQALRTLGWSAGYGRRENEALEWVQEQRAYGRGGTYNVGAVVRRSQRNGFPYSNQAELPKGVDRLHVTIHQITPAVTCLVVGFVLDEASQRLYEDELNRERRTRRERRGLWKLSILDPYHQKLRAINSVRRGFQHTVRNWFSRTLPGHFSRSDEALAFPFAELLSTAGDDLFSARESARPSGWGRIVANAPQPEVWHCSRLPALRFAVRQRWEQDEMRNVLTAAVSAHNLPEDQLKMYGGDSAGVIFMCHEALEGPLAYIGVAAYLTEISRGLKVARDGLNLAKARQPTLRVINQIREFFDGNAGVPAVARELRDATKQRGQIEHYCENFTASQWGGGRRRRNFVKELRRGLQHAAATLIEDESSTREHLEQLSAILSVRESIRAQRRMEVLTIFALAVAALSLAAALPKSWIDTIRPLFG